MKSSNWAGPLQQCVQFVKKYHMRSVREFAKGKTIQVHKRKQRYKTGMRNDSMLRIYIQLLRPDFR